MSGVDDPAECVTPAMLALMDPDPAIAESRLQKLIDDLTRSLEMRGCRDPEGVAAESVYRGLKRAAAGAAIGDAGLRGYVFGIAKNVVKEGWRAATRERQLDPNAWARRESTGREHQSAEAQLMLEQMQRLLSDEEWRMLVRYYTESDHLAHSRELKVTPGYLRVMIHRIRERLKAKVLGEHEREPRHSPRPDFSEPT